MHHLSCASVHWTCSSQSEREIILIAKGTGALLADAVTPTDRTACILLTQTLAPCAHGTLQLLQHAKQGYGRGLVMCALKVTYKR
jgi:hypothetical protein